MLRLSIFHIILCFSAFAHASLDSIATNIKEKTVNWQLSRTLQSHKAEVSAVKIVNNKYIVSGSYDNTIKVWDLESGNLINTLDGHEGDITALATTKNNKYIIASSLDLTISIWNFETSELVHLITEDSVALTLAVTSDNKFLVAGFRDCTVKIFDLENCSLVKTLVGHSDLVTSIAIVPDNSTIISGSWDKTIKVWDFKSGKLLRTLAGHTDSITTLTVDADDVASLSMDQTLKIWEIQTGKLKTTIGTQPDIMHSLNLTSDNKYLIFGSGKFICILDLSDSQKTQYLTGHTSNVCSVTVSDDCKYIVSGSYDKTVKIWKQEADKPKTPVITDSLTDLLSAKFSDLNLKEDIKKQSNLSAKTEKKEHKCAKPDCQNHGSLRCARCKLIYYCSQECQRAHWAMHKSTCQSK